MSAQLFWIFQCCHHTFLNNPVLSAHLFWISRAVSSPLWIFQSYQLTYYEYFGALSSSVLNIPELSVNRFWIFLCSLRYLERSSRTRLIRPNSSSFLQNNKPYVGLQFYGPINMHNLTLNDSMLSNCILCSAVLKKCGKSTKYQHFFSKLSVRSKMRVFV
jgi:hypothetical protein